MGGGPDRGTRATRVRLVGVWVCWWRMSVSYVGVHCLCVLSVLGVGNINHQRARLLCVWGSLPVLFWPVWSLASVLFEKKTALHSNDRS